MIETQDLVLAELTRQIVERFTPERIVLFGSRARGDHHPDSDYDVMIVLGQSPCSAEIVRRVAQELRMSVDAFVNTREQFERRRTPGCAMRPTCAMASFSMRIRRSRRASRRCLWHATFRLREPTS